MAAINNLKNVPHCLQEVYQEVKFQIHKRNIQLNNGSRYKLVYITYCRKREEHLCA